MEKQSSMTTQKLEQALSLIISSGYQLDNDAFIFLKTLMKTQDIQKIVEDTLKKIVSSSDQPIFITKEMLNETLEKQLLKREPQKILESVVETFRPHAKDVEAEIEIKENSMIGSDRKVSDFINYFQDRFTRIRTLFKHRLDARDAVSISEALKAPMNSRIKIIGIVTEIRERKKNIFMQLEDYEASVTILFASNISARSIFQKAQKVFLDQVICVQGKRARNKLIVATDLINPDIPEKPLKKMDNTVHAALISDLHIGNKQFLEKSFNYFIRWLKGQEGNHRQKEAAGKIKYLVICGDIVDGVGIYPNQEKELAVKDIYEQYKKASLILQKIPDYIEIIIIPGNHDAIRQALPQPPILKKYAEPLYNLENVKMLGNTVNVSLHGIDFLLYHGRSLDDIIGVLPNVSYRNLKKDITIAMRYLLKIRHLAPIYGGKTPIAPETKDFLIIDTPPDVFHSGHVHVTGYEIYRGTLIANSGTWQGQTEFQKKMDIQPTPGVIPIINLSNLNIMPITFTSTF
jgi:DNA polymerase II small subunit